MKGKVLAYFFREAGTPYQGFVTGDIPEDIFHVLGKHGDPYAVLLMPITGTGGSIVAWENASGGGVPRQHECLYFESTAEFPLSRRDGWVTFVELFGVFDRHAGRCVGGTVQLQPTPSPAPPSSVAVPTVPAAAPPPAVTVINNNSFIVGAGMPMQVPIQQVPAEYVPPRQIPVQRGAIGHLPAGHIPAQPAPVQPAPVQRVAPIHPETVWVAPIRPTNRWLYDDDLPDDGDGDGGGCLDDGPWMGTGMVLDSGDGQPPTPTPPIQMPAPAPIAEAAPTAEPPPTPPAQAAAAPPDPCLPVPAPAATDAGDAQPTPEPAPPPSVASAPQPPAPVAEAADVPPPSVASAPQPPAPVAEAADVPAPEAVPATPAATPTQMPTGDATGGAGQQFLQWLADGIRSRRHPINHPSAFLHTVTEGLLLTPRAFHAYSPDNGKDVQQAFLNLKLHKQAPDGGDIWHYNVQMARGAAPVGFLLVADPLAVLGLPSLPPPNKTLSLPTGNKR